MCKRGRRCTRGAEIANMALALVAVWEECYVCICVNSEGNNQLAITFQRASSRRPGVQIISRRPELLLES